MGHDEACPVQVQVPAPAYLESVEELYAGCFPRPFLRFCQTYTARDVGLDYPSLRGGCFICDIASLRKVVAQLGREQWVLGVPPHGADNEQTLYGRLGPASSDPFRGGLVPFYFRPVSQKVIRRHARRQRKGWKERERYPRDVYESNQGLSGFDVRAGKSVYIWSVDCVVHIYSSFEAWLEKEGKNG